VVELLEYKPKINTEGGLVPSKEETQAFLGEISLKGV
jgi:hypothetical protein